MVGEGAGGEEGAKGGNKQVETGWELKGEGGNHIGEHTEVEEEEGYDDGGRGRRTRGQGEAKEG